VKRLAEKLLSLLGIVHVLKLRPPRLFFKEIRQHLNAAALSKRKGYLRLPAEMRALCPSAEWA